MIGDVLVRIGADISDYQRNLNVAGKDLEKFGSQMASAGTTIAATFGAVAVATAGGIGIAVKAASDYESAFAGVRKTTEATEAEYTKLSKGIRDMAKEIPASAEEIAKVAEVAGQLGIHKDNLLEFTRTMVDLGVATNMSSEEAATSLARLANITGMAMEDIDRLGSTVVHLGNNLATTESEIVEMGLRLAGAGNQVGMTEAQILSFAGSLSSVGIAAEAGGTAFSRVFLNMNTAVMNGGKELEKFAKVAGMSSSDFAKAFEKDAASAIITFIEGLDKMSQEGANTAEVLSDLGLGEIRVRDALMRAAGASDVFSGALELGNKAWDENNALSNEAAERYATFASKVQILRNRISGIVRDIGGPFMDTLSAMIDGLDPVISAFERFATWFANSSGATKTFITTMVIMIPVLAALAAGFGLFLVFIGMVTSAVGTLAVTFGGLGAAMLAGLKIAALTTGIGLIISAVVALSVVVAKNWDKIKSKTSEMVSAVSESLSGFTGSVVDAFKDFGSGALGGIMTAFGFVADLVGSGFDTMREAGITFVDVAKGLVNFLPTLISLFLGLTGPIGWLISGLMFLATKTNVVSDMIKVFKGEMEFSEAIGNMATMASEFVTNLAEMATDAIVMGSEILINLIQGITDALPQLIETAIEVVSTLIEAWIENIPMITETALTIINALLEGFTLALPSILESAVLIITTLLEGIIEVLPTLIEIGIEILNTIISAIVESLPLLTGAAILLLTELLDAIISNLPMIIEAGIELLNSLIEGIIETLPALVDAALLLITSLIDALITSLPKIIEAGIKLLVALIEGLIKAIPQLLEAAARLIWELLKGIAKMIPDIIEMGITLVKELVVGLGRALFEIGEAAVEIGEELLTGIGDFATDMIEIGKDLIEGLAKGIKEMAGRAIDAAKEVASNIWGSVKGFFGIKSPSRLFRYGIGQMLGEGLVLGMQDELSSIAKMAEKVSEAATPEQPKLAGLDVGDFRGHAHQMSAQLQADMSGTGAMAASNDTYNFRGMLEGATFVVREEADIDRIAERLAQRVNDAKARKGIR